MPVEDPILTIGIPTWNRVGELSQSLELLIPQVAGQSGVEILICDNASTDETQAYMERLADQYNFIRYTRNEVNIGGDLNFIEVLRHSRGGHVWLLSDDDFVTEGAVAELIRIIRTYNPSYISANYQYCDDQKRLLSFQPPARYMVKKDISHADINRIFHERAHWLSFMSCKVFRRNLIDCDDYVANLRKVPNWIQVYMATQVLAKDSNGYLSSFVLVLARAGNDRVNDNAFALYMPDSFHYMFQRFGVSSKVEQEVMEEIRRTFLPFSAYLIRRAKNLRTSSLLIPLHYKIALLLPSKLILMAWKLKRALAGRPQPV